MDFKYKRSGQLLLSNPNSRLLIDNKGKVTLFANPKKIKNIRKLFGDKIVLTDEDNLDKVLKSISNKSIWLDKQSCSVYHKMILSKKNQIIQEIDPIYFLKSIKNKTEIKNIEKPI